MTISFFLTVHDRINAQARLTDADASRTVSIVKTTPGLTEAMLFTPERASDPYLNDGPPPQLVAQLHFGDITALESALRPGGHLHALAATKLTGLDRAEIKQQAMLARFFPVPDPTFRTPAGSLPCSYLVSYPGPAQDLNVWQHHYITSHPPIMARFPGIRGIEIHTRIDWVGFLPWPRENMMLRNRVVFDDQAGLAASLTSPVRHEMRADYARFPPFEGGSVHYPMATSRIAP